MVKRLRLGLVGVLLALITGPVWADYAQEWGPKVGTQMPAIGASDQDGTLRTLENLQGENGVLILFNRSADW